MSGQADDSTPRYALVAGDRYDAERDAYAFQLASVAGPAQATRWVERLKQIVDELPNFPGPLSHARDEEASTLYNREVRRLLYHGPGHRRSKQPVRILFTLFPPAEDDPDGETVISLLRLLRGGQSLHSSDDSDAASNSD